MTTVNSSENYITSYNRSIIQLQAVSFNVTDNNILDMKNIEKNCFGLEKITYIMPN